MITNKKVKAPQALHTISDNKSKQKHAHPRKRKIVKVVLLVLAALIVALGIFIAYVYPGEYHAFEERKSMFCKVYHVDPDQAIGAPCPICYASGYHPYHFFGLISETCDYCHGVGWITLEMEREYYDMSNKKTSFETFKKGKENAPEEEERVETLGEGVFPSGHTYYYVSSNGLAASVHYYMDKQDERCFELGGVDDVQYNGTYVYSRFHDNMNDFQPFSGYQNKMTNLRMVNNHFEYDQEEVKSYASWRSSISVSNDYRRIVLTNMVSKVKCVLEIAPQKRYEAVQRQFQARRKNGEVLGDGVIISGQTNAAPSSSSESERGGAESYRSLGRTCPDCGGNGRCRMCQGRGFKKVIGPSTDVEDPKEVFQNCQWCNGSGQCKTCYGKGKIQ